MNIIHIELRDENDKNYKFEYPYENSLIRINDKIMDEIFTNISSNIIRLKSCTLKLGVENMTLIIKNYTKTEKIFVESFIDIKSRISILQVIGTSIHIVDQHIDHLQTDCKSILLANCNVEKMDIGLMEQHKQLENKETKEVYHIDILDLKDTEMGRVDVYAECAFINIQGCEIQELNNNGSAFKNITSKVNNLHIWQNTNIRKLSISNEIEKLKLDDATITKLVARSRVLISEVEITDSIVENCFGFVENSFEKKSYDTWKFTVDSAINSGDLKIRSEAKYQMVKYLYLTEKKENKPISWIFDYCAGYGYKPIRTVRASLLVIITCAIIYSGVEFFKIINRHSINIKNNFIGKCVQNMWSNLLLSVSAFAGQSNLTIADGVIFWISVIEYILGIIIFAIFVNSLYVRYKD